MPNIIVAHCGTSDELWINVMSDSGWSGDTQISNTETGAAPSTLFFGNAIWVIHNGAGGLWFNTNYGGLDTEFWQGDTEVSGTLLSHGPSALLCETTPEPVIYVFHQGTDRNGELWVSPWSSGKWLGDSQVQSQQMAFGPSAVQFQGSIYVFSQGRLSDHVEPGFFGTVETEQGNGTLQFTVLTPPTIGTDLYPAYSSEGELTQVSMSSGPGAVVYGNELWVFYQGGGNDGMLWYICFDGNDWGNPLQVPTKIGMSECPSPVVVGSDLYVFYQGGGNDQNLYYSTLIGGDWTVDLQVPNTNLTYSPSAFCTP
jgi:hypothetical protein